MKSGEKFEHKNRLDVEMFRRGICRSRSEAHDLIERNKVTVNGITARKSSAQIKPSDSIEVLSPARFVSRAGEKLAYALEAFKIDARDLVAIDIGSSTGGFTDCLLKHGAKKVISIDVGSNQFSNELKDNPRVELHESTDVREFSMAAPVDLVAVDVSFISLSLVLPKVFELLKSAGRAVALVKPQFEVGMEVAKKSKGVITDKNFHQEVLERIKQIAQEAGFKVLGETPSPIEGEKGNKEFLLLLQK